MLATDTISILRPMPPKMPEKVPGLVLQSVVSAVFRLGLA
jgi:hypothetical protein